MTLGEGTPTEEVRPEKVRAIDRLREILGLPPIPEEPASETDIELGKIYGLAIDCPSKPDGSPGMTEVDWPI